MASEQTKQFTDSNFDAEVLKASQLVLVDFWAEWCPPCKKLGPTIDKLATEYASKAKIGKMDTDSNHATAIKYGISSIPTLIFFKNGEPVMKKVGYVHEPELRNLLDTL